MKIICSECGQEMEAEHREMSPGSNEECWVVQPCCISDEKLFELEERILDQVVERYEPEREALQDLKDEISKEIAIREKSKKRGPINYAVYKTLKKLLAITEV